MFAPQVDMLLAFGDVMLIDFPGHGKSKAAKSKNTMALASQCLDDLAKKHKLNNICLIGLNNGANIALNTCYQYKLPIEKMILIDPPICLTESFTQEIQLFSSTIRQSIGQDKAFKQHVDAMVNNLLPRCNEAYQAIAREAFISADKSALADLFDSLIEWDQNAKTVLASINIPTLCVLTDEHHCSFERLKKAVPSDVLIGKLIGSSCWATLDAPQQLNAMIAHFLSLSGP